MFADKEVPTYFPTGLLFVQVKVWLISFLAWQSQPSDWPGLSVCHGPEYSDSSHSPLLVTGLQLPPGHLTHPHHLTGGGRKQEETDKGRHGWWASKTKIILCQINVYKMLLCKNVKPPT